jgi:hypothetical protein
VRGQCGSFERPGSRSLRWAGSLWARLRRAEGGQPRLALVAVLGLVLGGASSVAAQAISATVAIEQKDVGASGAKFFFVLAQALGSGITFGVAALVLATSVLVLRTKVFPVWLGWVGLLDGTSSTISAFGFASFIIWAIWIITTSVIMFRTNEPAPAA